jgi:hypothetical protein
MKKLFVLLGLLCLSLTSFAAVDSKKIMQVADELSKLLPSHEYNLQAASPLEMLTQMAAELEYDDFNYNPQDAINPDSTAWGIIKMSQAIKWVANAELLENNSSEGQKAANLIKSLYGTGVVFGASPTGAVQCGVTFAALLLIDTAKGVIHSFDTEDSGC